MSVMVFPATHVPLEPAPFDQLKYTALMKLADQTIWMLTVPERPWTEYRLHTAAEILSEILGVLAERARGALDADGANVDVLVEWALADIFGQLS